MQYGITCPHCHTPSNHGVRVCIGCQAEVHYGAPPAAYLCVLVAAVAGGTWAGAHLYATAGWICAVVILATGISAVHQLLRDRVVFKRIYHTR